MKFQVDAEVDRDKIDRHQLAAILRDIANLFEEDEDFDTTEYADGWCGRNDTGHFDFSYDPTPNQG